MAAKVCVNTVTKSWISVKASESHILSKVKWGPLPEAVDQNQLRVKGRSDMLPSHLWLLGFYRVPSCEIPQWWGQLRDLSAGDTASNRCMHRADPGPVYCSFVF